MSSLVVNDRSVRSYQASRAVCTRREGDRNFLFGDILGRCTVDIGGPRLDDIACVAHRALLPRPHLEAGLAVAAMAAHQRSDEARATRHRLGELLSSDP